MRDRKKPEPPAEASAPAWMATFGDLVTNLLTFFVLLFAFSSMDESKADELVSAFKGMEIIAIPPLDPNAPEKTPEGSRHRVVITPNDSGDEEPENADETEDGMTAEVMGTMFDELYEKIKLHISENKLDYILNVDLLDEFTILLRMSDAAFFDSGRAIIKQDAKDALDAVASILVEYTDLIHTIHIQGHADNVPIGRAGYKDNWDLSAARAENVFRYFLRLPGIDPAMLAPSYYGDTRPVSSNETEEGKAKNRRVDFLIESKLKD